MILTKSQNEAVEKIYSYFSNTEKVRVDFKAPTGCGKTIMAAWLISNIIERNFEEKFIFIIATPSTSSLPFFFEQKINVYKRDLPYSKFDVEYIESPSTNKDDTTEKTQKIKIVKNKVYIFGKATFGAKRIFTEQHVIDDFIDEAITLGYKIIYIRDEAHIGDLRNDNETNRFESLMLTNAHFVLKMTATPNFNDNSVKIVTLSESELNDITKNENKWLLKTKPIILLNRNLSEEELLDNALCEFKEIKEKYRTLENNGTIIYPALLIQVSNEPQNKEEKKEFIKYIEFIKQKLDFYNLSWVQYFGEDDKDSNRSFKKLFTLDDVTKNNAQIDVVLFKVGPSTGWDIPRACMLLQLRKVCSERLNIQTIGRIKRNPFPGLAKNEITDRYYIYSNAPQVDENLSYYNYEVKCDMQNEKFPSIQIVNKIDFKLNAKQAEIDAALLEYMYNNQNILIQDIRNMFVEENGTDIFRKELYEVNGAMVYSSISNPFSFLKIHKRLLESKNDVYSVCKSAIQKSYDNWFAQIKIYNNNL